jgi:hypothetical protein
MVEETLTDGSKMYDVILTPDQQPGDPGRRIRIAMPTEREARELQDSLNEAVSVVDLG